jgi:hypothetical protein
MHGTFRVHARFSQATEPGFAPAPVDVRGYGWARTAVLLTGWTLLGTAWGALASGQAPPEAPAARSPEVLMHPAIASPQRALPAIAEPEAPAAVTAPIQARLDRFVPVVRIDLPAPVPAPDGSTAPDPLTEPPTVAIASTPSPASEAPPPLPPEAPPAPAPIALRPVDIAQIADSNEPSSQIAQIDPPGAAPDDVAIAEKAQMAQLSVSSAVERELALLQEDAPSEVAVRLGDRAIGKVAIRISQINTIDVQLSGLLDVMADSFAPEEFTRLRNSAAAGTYVPLDELRAAGLGLRYDPVYDELVVSA